MDRVQIRCDYCGDVHTLEGREAWKRGGTARFLLTSGVSRIVHELDLCSSTEDEKSGCAAAWFASVLALRAGRQPQIGDDPYEPIADDGQGARAAIGRMITAEAEANALRARVAELEAQASRPARGVMALIGSMQRSDLATMHRRAQRAESATAAARREAAGQRRRAEWWRAQARVLGWTLDPKLEVDDQPMSAGHLVSLIVELERAVGIAVKRCSDSDLVRLGQHDRIAELVDELARERATVQALTEDGEEWQARAIRDGAELTETKAALEVAVQRVEELEILVCKLDDELAAAKSYLP